MTAACAVWMGMTIISGTPGPQGRTLAPCEKPHSTQAKGELYDGNWWLARDWDEKSAFLDGASDCLFYVAHARWLSRNVDDLEGQIDEYYRSHAGSRDVPVTTVWRIVLTQAPAAKPRPSGGEVWTNRHGFYDGTYWIQLHYESTQHAFLQGYLWCMRTCLNTPPASYSMPVAYYARRISAYIRSHPKTAYDKPVADILSRFSDRPGQKGPKDSK